MNFLKKIVTVILVLSCACVQAKDSWLNVYNNTWKAYFMAKGLPEDYAKHGGKGVALVPVLALAYWQRGNLASIPSKLMSIPSWVASKLPSLGGSAVVCEGEDCEEELSLKNKKGGKAGKAPAKLAAPAKK